MENNDFEYLTGEEADAILPDGWTEDADFFSLDWAGEEFAEDEAAADEGAPADGEDETAQADPTTDEPAAETKPEEEKTGEEPAEQAAPTTEPAADAGQAGKRTFRINARVDHEDQEVEINEDDLPAIYQKSTATERYQKKLAEINPVYQRMERIAKANGFESIEAMLDAQEAHDREQAVTKLMEEGAPKTIAEDYVDRQFRASRQEPEKTEEAEETYAPESAPAAVKAPQDSRSGRDLAAEVQELWSLRPDLQGTTLPSEVAAAAAQGKNLVHAYLSYEAKQSREAADVLRKENEILKQNAAAAAKAPVKGVSGGGKPAAEPEDPFLMGLNSGW